VAPENFSWPFVGIASNIFAGWGRALQLGGLGKIVLLWDRLEFICWWYGVISSGILTLVKPNGIRSGLIFGGRVRQVALGNWLPLPVIRQELVMLRPV
jgi:hypothetical protein